MGALQGQVDSLRLVSHSEEETRRIGSELGKLVQAGDLILLTGELGTGKTCLAQGLARGLGIVEPTPSPSFVLVREYQGRHTLYHLDFYRLEEKEIEEMGLEDYLSRKGVCVVEWAERGLKLLPPEHLLVELWHLSQGERRLRFSAYGERHVKLLSELKKRWNWP